MNTSTETLALWLVDFYVATTVLLLVAVVAMCCLRQPARRLAVAWATMVGLAALAILCALPQWPRISWRAQLEASVAEVSTEGCLGQSEAVAQGDSSLSKPVPGKTVFMNRPDLGPPSTAEVPDADEALAAESTALEEKPTWLQRHWAPAVLVPFAGGMSLMVVWLLLGAVQTALLCRTARQAPEWLRAELREVIDRRRRPPRLLVSSRLTGPIATGIFRPTIIVPSSFLDPSDSKGLALVLVHEWAHIRNCDLWLLAAGRLLVLLLFAHPLHWWLQRRIREDQEAVADAEVASHASRTDYARELVSWARRVHGRPAAYAAALGIWERPSSLARRIKILLDETFHVRVQCSRRWRYGALILAGLLTLGASLPTAQPPTPAGADPPHVEESRVRASTHPTDDAKGLTYHGKVIDGTTGKPIRDAVVTARLWIDPRSESDKPIETIHRTDAKGNYRFALSLDKAARQKAHVGVRVSHPDYAPFELGFPLAMIERVKKLGQNPFGQIPMWPGARIWGTVVGPDTKPLEGVKVRIASNRGAYASMPPAQASTPASTFADETTDALGRFEATVIEGGQGQIEVIPEQYAPLIKKLPKRYGDLGRFALKEGIRISGTVVDVDGSALPGITVCADSIPPSHTGDVVVSEEPTLTVDLTETPQPAKELESADETAVYYSVHVVLSLSTSRHTVTDKQGRFTMAPLAPGKYQVIPRPDSWADDSPGPTALAVFLPKEVTITEGKLPEPIEFRAVQHVSVTIKFLDGAGRPLVDANANAWLQGQAGSNPVPFGTAALANTKGKTVLLAPKGLKAVRLGFFTGMNRVHQYRRSKDATLRYGTETNLGTLERDIPGFTVISRPGATLGVKAIAEDGTAIRRAVARIRYPKGTIERDPRELTVPRIVAFRRQVGDVLFAPQPDGRWRTQELILPDQQFTLTVEAPGYESRSEKMTLPEGATKKITWPLKKMVISLPDLDDAKKK